MRNPSEEGDALPDQNRDSSDDDALDETGSEEPLDGLSPIDVDVLHPSLCETGHDLLRSA
jgi:hypothetical protein